MCKKYAEWCTLFLGDAIGPLSVLSCHSVCNVGVLWPNGWIDQDASGMEVVLGPDHTVLDGDPAPPKGAQPPIFGPCLLWPNRRIR